MSSSNSVIWNRRLIERYDLSGPRYTSYPTAPHFHEQFSVADMHSAIDRSNAAGRPLSLYFHIPFCITVCYYCACNKIITANRSRAMPYLERLIEEIAMQGKLFDRSRPVHQLHWGGGTPTYISNDEKRLLMAATREHFNILDDDSGEYSVEIHPGETEVSAISCLRELGFNRLSMGVQDFDPVVQKAVNRFNSVKEVRELVDAAKKEGFQSINMDLIYGLPHQSWSTFSYTLDSIIDLNPERLSVFNYAHMPHLFKVQKQLDESTLPSPEEKLLIMERMTEKLLDAGYVYIGMDHFAKPTDGLVQARQSGTLHRNFQGYTTHGHCDLIALGVSAISKVGRTFAQNAKTLETYYAAIDAGEFATERGYVVSDEDLIAGDAIQELMCSFHIDIPAFNARHNIDFWRYFDDRRGPLEEMVANGLVELSESSLRVTETGRFLVRNICMVFDEHLSAATGFSKTI